LQVPLGAAELYREGSCCWRCLFPTSLVIRGHCPVFPDQQVWARSHAPCGGALQTVVAPTDSGYRGGFIVLQMVHRFFLSKTIRRNFQQLKCSSQGQCHNCAEGISSFRRSGFENAFTKVQVIPVQFMLRSALSFEKVLRGATLRLTVCHVPLRCPQTVR